MTIRDEFLHAASTAADLLGSPAVAEKWDEPSVLPAYLVSGLAGHLAGQIFMLRRVLTSDLPTEEPLSVARYYAQSAWLTAEDDHESHVRIREGSIANGQDGPAALAARAADTVAALRVELPTVPDRLVRLPLWGPFSLRLDDFALTRTMELAVHSDDLAVSVGVDTPTLPPTVTEVVVDLLSRIAIHRHGPTAVLRALSRADRAPETISAL